MFWMKAEGRSFSTVAEDHANCSVGSVTHGFRTLEEVGDKDDVGALVGAVDGILQQQAVADAQYLFENVGRTLSDVQRERIAEGVLKAYRWQYIVSGVQDPRFLQILQELVSESQMERIVTALAAIIENGSPRDSVDSTARAA